MNNEERFWEIRFKALNEQYTQLKEEYSHIKEEYIAQFHSSDKLEKENDNLKRRLDSYMERIEKLEKKKVSLKQSLLQCSEEKDEFYKQNLSLMQKLEELALVLERLQKQEIRRSSNNESLNDFAKSLSNKWPRVLNSLSLFLPHSGLYDRNQADHLSTRCPTEATTTGKTPQANPDQSLAYDNLELKMFESFFLLGISGINIGKPQIAPEILYEYGENAAVSSHKKILSDFCFPSEVQCRPVRYSASEEEINNILFGQEQELRGSNCYIFTLRSNETPEGLIEYSDLPNADKELIYCICVQVEDIGINSTRDSEWINTKCLCLLTFVPCFELHFKFLRALLQLKKLWRMETMSGYENVRISLRKLPEEIPPKWLEMLSLYQACEEISPGCKIFLEDSLIPPIEYVFHEDLSMIDIPWLLNPLIGVLDVQDFLWLVSALVQEKSVVFVSYNLDLLSACVLAMQALLRPFKWPYIFIPIIPESLSELLEAPVPILAGLPGGSPDLRKSMTHLIWVFLDEPNRKRRVQYCTLLFDEVQELPNSLNKQEILAIYNTESQEVNITALIKGIWKKIIDKFKGNYYNDTDSLQNVVTSSFQHGEHNFLMNLIQTQMFLNIVEENLS